MTDDFNKENDGARQGDSSGAPSNAERGMSGDGPEPPVRWRPAEPEGNVVPQTHEQQAQRARTVIVGSTRFEIRNDEIGEFESARRYMTAAQIIAVLSLFLGGIMLSAVALVCAFAANSKLNSLATAAGRSAEAQRALKRSGVITIAVAAIALLLNILAIAFLYPYINEVMQTGSLDALTSTPQPGTTGNTTWG